MTLKTWHVENTVVGTFLLGVWWAKGASGAELLGSIAVFCGFCAASITDRKLERSPEQVPAGVDCYRLLWWFALGQQLALAAVLASKGSWSAGAGCIVGAIYPAWRKLWRSVHPLDPSPPSPPSS